MEDIKSLKIFLTAADELKKQNKPLQYHFYDMTNKMITNIIETHKHELSETNKNTLKSLMVKYKIPKISTESIQSHMTTLIQAINKSPDNVHQQYIEAKRKINTINEKRKKPKRYDHMIIMESVIAKYNSKHKDRKIIVYNRTQKGTELLKKFNIKLDRVSDSEVKSGLGFSLYAIDIPTGKVASILHVSIALHSAVKLFYMIYTWSTTTPGFARMGFSTDLRKIAIDYVSEFNKKVDNDSKKIYFIVSNANKRSGPLLDKLSFVDIGDIKGEWTTNIMYMTELIINNKLSKEDLNIIYQSFKSLSYNRVLYTHPSINQ